MAKKISYNGQETEIHPHGKTFVSLDICCILGTGNYAINLSDGRFMFIDYDQHIQKSLGHFNQKATALVSDKTNINGNPLQIYGEVLICCQDELPEKTDDDEDE